MVPGRWVQSSDRRLMQRTNGLHSLVWRRAAWGVLRVLPSSTSCVPRKPVALLCGLLNSHFLILSGVFFKSIHLFFLSSSSEMSFMHSRSSYWMNQFYYSWIKVTTTNNWRKVYTMHVRISLGFLGDWKWMVPTRSRVVLLPCGFFTEIFCSSFHIEFYIYSYVPYSRYCFHQWDFSLYWQLHFMGEEILFQSLEIVLWIRIGC